MFQKTFFLFFIISSLACSQEKKKIQSLGSLNEVLDCQTLDGLKMKYGPENVINDTFSIISPYDSHFHFSLHFTFTNFILS